MPPKQVTFITAGNRLGGGGGFAYGEGIVSIGRGPTYKASMKSVNNFRGEGSITSETSTSNAWNDFRCANKEKGWSPQEMLAAYQRSKG